ncbi:conserved hypothetical protein [Clostridium neonatale]|uniref:hypothetical protein n=1 Tax=Clostridium neonatale TaxID=137838 RepID=UPI00291C2ADB|nr:hypothetical protein [Clostridium neonatale]CAI3699228.1 conserved hypothetical protein [Clostridium neonatale]
MIKEYGDIPTTVVGTVRHITISSTNCLCGAKWEYGVVKRNGHSDNIMWRNLESVTCKKCKEIYINQLNNNE